MFDRKTANIFDDEPQSEISHVVEDSQDELQPEIAGIVHGEIKTSATLDHAFDRFAETDGPHSEISHVVYDKNALYKVPGSLAPPGESHKGIEDKCRFR